MTLKMQNHLLRIAVVVKKKRLNKNYKSMKKSKFYSVVSNIFNNSVTCESKNSYNSVYFIVRKWQKMKKMMM